MTTLAPALPTHLQSLIDIRLDTIDRILLGRIPRADRIAIVEEVSNQIEEMLARKEKDQPDREDILEVLGRLDPPEAYLPEKSGLAEFPSQYIYESDEIRKPGRKTVSANKFWLPGLITGIGACLFGFLIPPFGMAATAATESILIFLLFFTLPGIASLLLSVAAITLGILNPAKKVGDYILMAFAGLTLPGNLFIIGYSLVALLES